jgi:hypothetical protein
MKSRGLFFCVLLAPFTAMPTAMPQDLPPGVLLVSRIKAHVREQLVHMPQYTCLETFERLRKLAGPKAEMKPHDTVRLEVLFTGRKEFYDSPGGRNFKEENPVAFIGSGLIGSGMFAGHLQTLFVNDQGLFTYRGEDALAGRRAEKYDFRVPTLTSRYTIVTPAARAVVAMKGAFWADPVTFDLIRLEVRAADIPPMLEIADAISTVYYARTRIGHEDVLLPQTGQLWMLGTSGEQSLDRFEFTHCRSFQTESSITFAAPDAPVESPTAAAPKPAAAPITGSASIPAGLFVTIALDAALTDRAAVGELIEGKVAGNVAIKGKTVIPDGALVHGRIRRMERYTDMGVYFSLGLEFTEVEAGAVSSRFFANLENASPISGLEWAMVNGTSSERVRASVLPGVGTFFMRGAHFEIPKGWKMVWKTQALN